MDRHRPPRGRRARRHRRRSPRPRVTAGLALVAVAALASRAVLSLADVRRPCGPFADPLDLTARAGPRAGRGLADRRLRSPLLVVLAATCSWSAAGSTGRPPRASWPWPPCSACWSSARPRPRCCDRPAGRRSARVLWPLGVLAALELAAPGGARRCGSARRRPLPAAERAGPAPRPPPAGGGRRCRARRRGRRGPLRASASATCARRSSTTCARRSASSASTPT